MSPQDQAFLVGAVAILAIFSVLMFVLFINGEDMEDKFIYTLTTMWVEKDEVKAKELRKKNSDRTYQHVCSIGVFESKEKAEEFLLENWDYIHEYWNNTAVIEEWKVNRPLEMQFCKCKQWWYFSDNIVEKVPEYLETPPKEVMFNNGRQVMRFGFR